MSKVPFAVTPTEVATLPVPDRFSCAPVLMMVRPVKVLVPVSVSVPAATVMPPAPLITPSKVSSAAVRVSRWLPSTTLPAPLSVVIRAPAEVPLMSKVPSTFTPAEVAMLPVPVRFSLAPACTSVRPV